MRIKIKFQKTNETKEIELKRRTTIEELLKKLNIKPDTVIVMSKDGPVPIDDELTDEQELTILQVASGG